MSLAKKYSHITCGSILFRSFLDLIKYHLAPELIHNCSMFTRKYPPPSMNLHANQKYVVYERCHIVLVIPPKRVL